MPAVRSTGGPVEWSRKRKAALVVFALMMTYLHSLYILDFYVSEDEYWWPVWTGMTAGQRLLSLGLALFANLGLMTMPFLRAPGRLVRAALALSLAFGLVLSVAWLGRDLWVSGWPGSHYTIMLFSVLSVAVRIFYVATICLNLLFLNTMAKSFRPHRCE